MNKKQAWLIFGMKVLAILGAVYFLVSGVSELYAKADAGGTKETVQITVTPETEVIEAEAQATEQPEAAETERWSTDEETALAKIAMAEAESEGVKGKALVMLVVLNRVQSEDFADTIEDVIFEKVGGCWQFSTVADGGRYYSTEPDQECYEALELIESGWDESDGALYFESRSDSTWHQNNLEYLFKYGNHYFYK